MQERVYQLKESYYPFLESDTGMHEWSILYLWLLVL